jgi:hypothetical protein
MADNVIRSISAGLFERAKSFWVTAMFSKAAIAVMGLAAAYFHDATTYLAMAILAFELIASLAFYRADQLKSEAEPILVRLDYEESMGWKIPESSKLDWVADFQEFEPLGARVRNAQPYFAQTGPTGVATLRKNILESALYTRTISKNARTVVFVLFALLLLTFLALLITGTFELLATPHEPAPALITDALIALVTIDLLPLALRYGELADAAMKLRRHLNPVTAMTESNIIPAVVEYQVSRANGPLLPTFSFLARRLPLAAIWSRYDTDETDENVSSNRGIV